MFGLKIFTDPGLVFRCISGFQIDFSLIYSQALRSSAVSRDHSDSSLGGLADTAN